MQKLPLSSRPPKNNSKYLDEFGLEKFIQGANTERTQTPKIPESPIETNQFPWEDPSLREDVLKLFNLRLNEKYFKKLDYLAQTTKESKQKILLDILIPGIDASLKKIIEKNI